MSIIRFKNKIFQFLALCFASKRREKIKEGEIGRNKKKYCIFVSEK